MDLIIQPYVIWSLRSCMEKAYYVSQSYPVYSSEEVRLRLRTEFDLALPMSAYTPYASVMVD